MPPVITGQSLVTDQVYKILLSHCAKVTLIPINDTHSVVIKKWINYFLLFLNFTVRVLLVRRQIVYIPGARTVVGFWRNAYIIILSKIMNHTVVLHFHTGDYNGFLNESSITFQKINKWVFRKVDYYIILSESLIKNYDLIISDFSKIKVIPNGVPLVKKIKNVFFKEEINILYLSNLIESKGYLDLLNAINILVNDFNLDNIKCNFCGDFLESSDDILFKNSEDAKAFFYEYVAKNNLSKNVVYHGLLRGTLKEEALAKCDIFVLPTYYSAEAQPISILEALSYGKIVITTAHRAIADMITDGVNGLVVPPHAPNLIAHLILKLLNDSNLCEEISNNAKITVQENYSNDIFKSRVSNFFRHLDVI
jgi:glycosyltransferase involved in cell wall biosynthesis